MRRSILAVIIALFFIAAIFVSVLYFINFDGKLSNDLNDWALTGNYFAGTIGSIFGIISVILLIYTFDIQNSNINLQQFESTFFNLLNFQRQIVSSMKGKIKTQNNSSADDGVGLQYIDILVSNLIENNSFWNIIDSGESNQKIGNIVERYYFLEGKIHTLDAYFKHLQQIIEFVDESKVLNKKKYIKIIQSQMSNNEIYICFINSFSKYANDNFRNLLNKYDFFSYTINNDIHLDRIYNVLYNINLSSKINKDRNFLSAFWSKIKNKFHKELYPFN